VSATYAPPFSTTSTTWASAEEHAAVTVFLAREAEAADQRDYATWLTLVADDYTYQVPVPRTPDNPFSPAYDTRTMLIDESKWSLESQWFRRLDKEIYELSWAENPPIRFRHFVTNVRVRVTADPGILDVRSNVLLIGTRQSDAPKYVSGERTDAIERTADGFLLRRRWVVLDQVVIDFPQLRILL
jgi:3-phenylpropionate/cinnamic acid dioxygenase small subunit